jgi:hypothetical protein
MIDRAVCRGPTAWGERNLAACIELMAEGEIRLPAVGWVLSGNQHIPGARINGLNLHRQLLRVGVASVVLRQPAGYSEKLLPGESDAILDACRRESVEVLILQKVNGPEAVQLVRRARQQRIATVFIACDTVDNSIAAACDVVFAVSEYLRSLFSRRIRSRITVLDDAVEVPEKFKESPIEIPDRGHLRAVFLSSSPPDSNITRLLDVCAETVDVTIISAPPSPPTSELASTGTTSTPARLDFGQQLYDVVSRHGMRVIPRAFRGLRYAINSRPISAIAPAAAHRFVEWKLASVYDDVASHHVGLVPIHLDSDFKMAKSANRLATFMALGMPSIVSPLPAYVDHVAANRTAVLARTPHQWRDAIRTFDRDRRVAQQMGRSAHRYAWEHFSIDVVTQHFIDTIRHSVKPAI